MIHEYRSLLKLQQERSGKGKDEVIEDTEFDALLAEQGIKNGKRSRD